MKKLSAYLHLTAALLLSAGILHAQAGNTITLPFPGVPTGGCSFIQLAYNQTNGALYQCSHGAWVILSSGGGSGTVTNFTAGNLSPLFTTSVATGSTTPALTFTASNAAADSWFGNATGSPAAASFNTGAIPMGLIPNPAGDVTGTFAATTVTGTHFGATSVPLSATAPTAGQIIYNNAGSLAGALDTFNAGTSLTTMGGSMEVTGPNPYYDVLANGMVCDGSTDDTAAFQTILNNINTGSGYGSIFFANTANPCIVKGFASAITSINLAPGSPPGSCTTTSSASTYCFEVTFTTTPPSYVTNGAPITILGTTGCTRTDAVNGEGCNGTYLVQSVSSNNVFVSAPASGLAGTPSTGSAIVSAYPWTNGILSITGQCAPRQNTISCSKIQTPSNGELPIYELAMVPCITAAPLSSTCPAGNATVNAVIRQMNFQGRTTTNNALGGLLVWGINGTLIMNNSFQAFVGSGAGCVSNCIPGTPGVSGLGAGITIWGGRVPGSGGTSALSNNQNNMFMLDQFSQMTYCITNQGQASGNTLLLEHCIPAGSGNNSGLKANQIGYDWGFTYSQMNSNVTTTGGENSFYGVQEELGAGGLFLDNTNEAFVGTFKLEQPNNTPYGIGVQGETLALSVKNSSAVTVYDVQNKNNCTGVHIDSGTTTSRISQTNTTGAVPGYCAGTGNLDGGSYADASNVSDATIPVFLNTNGNLWSSPSNQSSGSTFSGPGSYTPVENAYFMAANQNTGAFPVNVGNNVIAATSPNSSNTRISAFAYNAIPFFHGQESGGTQASPTATAANAFIAEFVGSAYNGTAMNGPSGMRVFTAQNQTTSNGGSNIDFQTIPNGSTTPGTVMELFNDGGVTIGSPTGGDKGAGSLNMQSCFINNVACGGGGGGSPGGSAGQYNGNNGSSGFAGAAALSNSNTSAFTGTVLATQGGTGGTDIPALQVQGYGTTPASDIFQVYLGGATPSSTCSTNAKCAFAVQANGNLFFLGNNVTYGTGGQSTQSFVRLYGNSTPNPAYFESLNGATGSVTSSMFCSITVSGLCGESSSGSPSGDVAAGTAFATNPMSAEGDLIYGHTQLGSLSLYTPTRLAVGSNGNILYSNGTDPAWGSPATAGVMSNTFPVTVSGATSGAIPYFSSATVMSSSSQLCQFCIVQGGGAGGAPTTGNGDFTIDSIAHTLRSGSAGIVDFSPSTTAMKVPSISGAVTSADAQVNFDNAAGAKNFHAFANSADAIIATVPVSNAVNGDCVKFVVSTNNVQLADTGAGCGGGGGATALSAITNATTGNTLTNGNHGAQLWEWAQTTNSQTAFELADSAAATGTSDILFDLTTATSSTETPFNLVQGQLTSAQAQSAINLTSAWNTTGSPTLIQAAVTNTSCTGGSCLLLNLLAGSGGSTSEFSVSPTGAGVFAATVTGTTFIGSVGLQGNAGTTAIRVQSGNDTNTVTAPGTLTLRGSNITAGSTANTRGGPALLEGGSTASAATTSAAGNVELLAGQATTATNLNGLIAVATSGNQTGTVTQWNLQSDNGSKTFNDSPTNATSIAGVALSKSGSIQVSLALTPSEVPINATAGVTLGHTVCFTGATAGEITDSGGTGGCGTGIFIGVVTATSGSYGAYPDGTAMATLSSSLPLVRLAIGHQIGSGEIPSVACAALPALTGDTTTSAGSCATTTSKVNGGTVPASAALLSTNGSSQIVAAASSTAPIAVSATGAISITGAAGQVLAGATPAFTATPTLGTDNSVLGTIQFANNGANAHTILGSAATTSNTVKLFATAPTTGDLVDCTTASTTCTLTDSGVLASQVVTSAANLTANQAVNGSGTQGSATGFSPTSSGTITSGRLACYTASNTVGNCTGLPSNNFLGVFNSSSTWIASGETSVALDATVNVTFGDILCASAGSAGTSHDNGNVSCATGEWVGIVKTTASSVSSATAFVSLR